MKITEAMLNKARTKKGGYSQKQIEIGKELAGSKSWRSKLVGRDLSPEDWKRFYEARIVKTPVKSGIVNHVPKAEGQFWKPNDSDIPKPKYVKAAAAKRARLSRKDDNEFRASPEFLALRERILRKHGSKCFMCGASPESGSEVDVYQIIPRSKAPRYALMFENQQVLCITCAKGSRKC